jgi:bifunctional non-homologous end joining protein LigD
MTESDVRTLEVGGRNIEIGHADKLLFPDDAITKYDLTDYYARIAPMVLRHYSGRALTMHRFPDGIDEEGFFQKQIGDHFPDWIDRATLPKKNGEVTYVVANDEATLVYLADQGCITPHLSLSRTDRPRHPDRMIVDLDPSDDDFDKVRRAAGYLKAMLDRLELNTFVQTTGSRGLHLVVPLDREADFEAVRAFSHALCRRAAEAAPDLMTVEQRKNKRGNRVFLDDLRNAYGQTAVAPYAVRARRGAPIATPVRWDEVDADLDPRRYRLDNIFRRLARVSDPWADIARYATGLPAVSDIP